MIAQCLFCNFVKDDRKIKKQPPLFLFNSTIPHIQNKSILFFHTEKESMAAGKKPACFPCLKEADRWFLRIICHADRNTALFHALFHGFFLCFLHFSKNSLPAGSTDCS